MPNQRASGQTSVLTLFKDEFLAVIDASHQKLGHPTRADLIRTAVFNELKNRGVKGLRAEFKNPPQRTGKGKE